MGSSLVTLTQHIEQEQVHVIEKGLVIQEELGQVAQVLTEQLLLFAVDLKHGDIGVAIDLIPWGMLNPAAFQVLQHLLSLLEEHKVVLTEVEHLQQIESLGNLVATSCHKADLKPQTVQVSTAGVGCLRLIALRG